MKSLLCIEDDADIQELISRTFYDRKVLKAFNAPDGIHLAFEHDVETILLDINLPGVPGQQAISVLKENPRTREIPLIVMTGLYRDPQTNIQCLELGADDFVLKPFSPEALRARVEAHLRRKMWSGKIVGGNGARGALQCHGGCISLSPDSHGVTLVRAHKTLKSIPLAPLEMNLLRSLMEERGRVVLYRRLLESLHHGRYRRSSLRAISKLAERLKRKILPCQDHIQTVYGYGFRFFCPEDEGHSS